MRIVKHWLLFLPVIFFVGCGIFHKPVRVDLDQIRVRGKLIAITGYSANSYFIYKGQTMGYEYELLNLLAQDLNLDLEIVIAHSMTGIFDDLNEGRGDIIAHNLIVTKPRRKRIAFTEYITTTRQVLVQRKPRNWRAMKLHEIDRHIITSPIDLIGKTIHVRQGSAYVERLKNLSDEIGGDIHIVEVPGDTSTDELIWQVAQGKIEYTIADENIAKINQSYYRDLDVRTPVSLPQRVAWAVRKSSPQLLAAVDEWIRKMKKKADYYVIYNKYFKNRFDFRRWIGSEYFSQTGGKISPYDSLLQVNTKKINWDWRLLASLVYQESQFLPFKKSWAGAVGLMQLMPKTAREFGARNLLDPQENIEAGTNYLHWLQNYWKDIPDSSERVKFILASYNVGTGHVQDARKLAEKYGRNPNIWQDNVAFYLLRKSQKEYYDDAIVNFGYCRGEEPIRYVNEILQRYEHYRNLLKESRVSADK